MGCYCVTETGIPVLRDSRIDADAERVLSEYRPSLLEKPQPVPIEEIAELYFRLAFAYGRLRNESGEQILGSVVFQDEARKFASTPGNEVAEVSYKRGTVLIDEELMDAGQENRLLSTIAHECGHWYYHQLYYKREAEKHRAIAARTCDTIHNILYSGRHDLITDEDWLEHQAGYFGGAILMPKRTFLIAANEREIRDFINTARAGADKESRDLILAGHLAKTFHVSRDAAYVRIRELNCGMGEVDYLELMRRNRELRKAKDGKARQGRKKADHSFGERMIKGS